MLEQAKQIAEGWKNTIIKDDHVEVIAKKRLEICASCEFNSEVATALGTYSSIRPDKHCTQCGCPLMSKTRCVSCNCPKDKWGSENDKKS